VRYVFTYWSVAFLAASPTFAEGEPSLSQWLKDGYSIVAIVVASDRETGLREIYLQKDAALIVCHLSTASTVIGGEGVDLRDCFIVDV
jgi:hypothetical protein